MPKPNNSSDSLLSSFWLNPNLTPHIPSGFKSCLENPIVLHEPEPEFALTVPGLMMNFDMPGEKKEWH